MSVTVLGHGALAELLRFEVQGDTPSTVIVVGVEGAMVVDSLLDLTDEMIDVMYEQPMQQVIVNLQEAHARGSHRIVVVVRRRLQTSMDITCSLYALQTMASVFATLQRQDRLLMSILSVVKVIIVCVRLKAKL